MGNAAMSRLSLIVSSIVIVCMMTSSCSGSAAKTDDQDARVKYAKDGTFTMSYDRDFGTFEPYHGIASSPLVYLTYDSLLNELPDGRLVSGIAEKWEATAKSGTFVIRSDVKCSDGTALTAGQVATAINYASDPKNQSFQYGLTTPTVPLKATGDDASRTVRIALQKPFGFLLQTIGSLPIACAKGLKDPKALTSSSAGTGPFVLSKVVPGQSATYTVRKDYKWGPNGASTSVPGTPARIVVRIVPNETTAANLLLSGELNFAQITGEDQERLAAQKLAQLHRPVGGTWLMFNQRRGHAAADKRVRQALVTALDLSQVVKVGTGGNGWAATRLIGLKPRACDDGTDTVTPELPKHDLAVANTLLDQAGWTKGKDGFRRKGGAPLTFNLVTFGTSTWDKPAIQLVSGVWSSLGIKTNITSSDPNATNAQLYEKGDWDVLASGWHFSLPSGLVRFLSGPVPPDGTNINSLNNKKYNELTAKAVTMTPPAACPYWYQAEQAIVGNLDVVPISNRRESVFLRRSQAQVIQQLSVPSPIPTSIRVLED